MPEKPEVVTVAKTLEKNVVGKKIASVKVYWSNIIEEPSVDLFCKELVGESIRKVTTRGKWLVFHLDNKILLVHLRMEGRFFYKTSDIPKSKHEHVIFTFDDQTDLRFVDTRKFGKMYLTTKDLYLKQKPLIDLGYEYDDPLLTKDYLYESFKRKSLPIKTVLLDQSIIAGIGNIYDDEILFLSHIHPLKRAKELTITNCDDIIKHTISVLDKAISLGGTTIRTYESAEGVHGRFQNELFVHNQKICPICGTSIIKITVGGRGTYLCEQCQRPE